MNGLPYYKAYPRDFIEGTIGMPFEVKGAYRLVLDLIYMQGGNLPDDARYISGLLGCTIRKWKSLRGDLISDGKLEVNGEFLTNKRAVSELKILAKLQENQRENRSKSNKNKDLEKPRSNHTEPDTEPKSNTSSFQSDVCLEAANAAPASPTVAELPAIQGKLVKITEADVAIWSEAYPAIDVRQQLSAIRAWLINNPKNAKTANGMRRFVNSWLGREQDRRGRAPSGAGPPARPKSAFQQRHEDARDRLNKALGINDDDELNYDDGKVIDLGRANYRG